MKKAILATLVALTLSASTVSATANTTEFNAFVDSVELSYDTEVANIKFTLYAVNESGFDCGDGDTYCITVDARDAWMYPIGKDFSVSIDKANDGIVGNEVVVDAIPQSTNVWDWGTEYVWSEAN